MKVTLKTSLAAVCLTVMASASPLTVTPCNILPIYRPDPFYAQNAAVSGLLLSFKAGIATLGTGFSVSWQYSASGPVAAWYPDPTCGWVYLNVQDTATSYKPLTWDKTWGSSWNATVDGYLTSIKTNTVPATKKFLACQLVAGTGAYANQWVLYLQTGIDSDVPDTWTDGTASFGVACVTTKLLVSPPA
ncbi:hypothetical protein FRC04_002286 [Tulasnella sp. 424]|nr:hypothetical protein FRC04_002286 [Tulasnella sp. 424]KAG8977359.1 hypothetical protein FRC05_001757 [Tulasnella sp. 425]